MVNGSVVTNGIPSFSKPKVVIFDYGRTLYDQEGGKFFPEVRKILEYLHPKYRLAIVSITNEGAPPEARLKALEKAGIRKFFSTIFFHEKDKDELLERVLQETGVKPSELILVDDRAKRSITWGNKRGAITIWLRKGRFAQELPNEETGIPTYIIENLYDLKELL